VKRDGKSLLEWIRIHFLKGWPGLAGPELGFSRTPTASVLRNDACLRLPARNTRCINKSRKPSATTPKIPKYTHCGPLTIASWVGGLVIIGQISVFVGVAHPRGPRVFTVGVCRPLHRMHGTGVKCIEITTGRISVQETGVRFRIY
jgi:hypothetical protein